MVLPTGEVLCRQHLDQMVSVTTFGGVNGNPEATDAAKELETSARAAASRRSRFRRAAGPGSLSEYLVSCCNSRCQTRVSEMNDTPGSPAATPTATPWERCCYPAMSTTNGYAGRTSMNLSVRISRRCSAGDGLQSFRDHGG